MSIAWQAQEYRYRKKSADWFWALGVVGSVIAVIAIVFGDLLFGIFIIIGVIALVIQSIRRPRVASYEVNEKGIRVGETFYPHSTLESFWVDDDPSVDKLILKSKKFFSPLITLPLGDTNPEEIRDFLLDFLEEKEHTLPLIERFVEHFGF